MPQNSTPGGLIDQGLVAPPVPTPTARREQHSIEASRNTARPYQAMPLVLGTHRVYPDLAAREYTEFEGGAQYLRALYSWGVGDLSIGPRSFGSIALDDLEGVTESTVTPGVQPAEADVILDAAAGAVLSDATWVSRATPAGTDYVVVDLVGRIFGGNSAAYTRHSVDVQIRHRAVGSTGGWTTATLTMTGDGAGLVRVSRKVDTGAGRWEVQVRRTRAPDETGAFTDDVTFEQLKSFAAPAMDRAADTLTSLRVRATAQLSGRLDRLHALVSQLVPTWDGGSWTAARSASSNPAAILRAFELGWHDANGNLLAGAGRAPTEVDDATLGEWYGFCASHNPPLGCDIVLRDGIGVEEVEGLIARCGRASISWRTGKLGVAWEDPDAIPVASVTPAHVIAGSVAPQWHGGPVAEEVVVRYTEPLEEWEAREVRRTMPGVVAPAYSVTVDLLGVTSSLQAAMMANLYAAAQRYHRRRIVWEMGRDGQTLSRGDVVWLSHDLVGGGVAGRLSGGDAAALLLDRDIEVAADTWLLLESPEGELHQSQIALAGGEVSPTKSVVLSDPLSSSPSVGSEGASIKDWTWRRYAEDAPPLKVRVVGVSRQAGAGGAGAVQLTAIDESSLYHAAATSDLSVDLTPARARTARVLSLFLAETFLRVGAGFAVEIQVAVAVAGDWRGGEIYREDATGERRNVARMGPGETTARWIDQPTGTIVVTVVPGSAAAPAGEAFSATYEILGAAAPPPAPTNFLVETLADGTRRLRWTPPDVPDLHGIVIRYVEGTDTNAPWDQLTPLHAGVLTASPFETFEPKKGQHVFAARAVDTGGRLSETDIRIATNLGDQRSADTVYWTCPSADGWPGTIVGGLRSNDGLDAIEGVPSYSWDNLTTWDAWSSFWLGGGTAGAVSMSYTTEVVDIGARLSFSLQWEGDTAGEVTFQYRAADTSAAVESAMWATYEAGTLVTGRWVQLRWSLAGDGSVGLRIDHLCWSAHAPTSEVRIEDADTSTWGGSLAAGRRVPADGLALVTNVLMTLQSVGAGASWELVGKAPPTVKIYDGAGTPVDATVDVIVRGIQSA